LTSARFTLECPRCGGALTFMEGAAAVDCPSCRGRFFLGEDGSAGWLLPPTLEPEAALDAAKRWLRENGRRVTRIDPPEGVLIPIYWSRGLRFVWRLEDPAREREAAFARSESAFRRALGEPSAFGSADDFEAWEARAAVEAFTYTFPAHPLARPGFGGAVRFQSRPLSLLDPDRLPAGYRLLDPTLGPEEAQSLASRRLTARERNRERGRGPVAGVDLHRRLNLAAVPAILVPFRFRDADRGAVLVDAVSGRAREAVDAELLAAAERPIAPGRLRHPELLPLECGECGWELDLVERDRLHPCPNCGACWEMVGRRRCRVRQWFLDVETGRDGRLLPFWVFGDGGDAERPPAAPLFVPAYAARHPEAQMHLAATLTRRPPAGDWYVDPDRPPRGAAVGSEEARGWHWAVEGALSRDSYSDFARFLKETGDDAPGEAPAGLVWFPFRVEGGDLVEPVTGARTRAVGTTPWELEQAA
jgi:predicted RNA-binding Zn-ribbon protein involved in translation (DUF1610 family)